MVRRYSIGSPFIKMHQYTTRRIPIGCYDFIQPIPFFIGRHLSRFEISNILVVPFQIFGYRIFHIVLTRGHHENATRQYCEKKDFYFFHVYESRKIKLKINDRCCFSTFCGLKLGFLFKPEHRCDNRCRETTYHHIETLHGLGVASTCYGNTIFRSFELGLQFEKILIGLQIGIILCNSQQTG